MTANDIIGVVLGLLFFVAGPLWTLLVLGPALPMDTREDGEL